MAVVITKSQERDALEQIRSIIESLGADSYVGAAFEGCLDMAGRNIENDFVDSMLQRAEAAEMQAEEAGKRAEAAEKKLAAALAEVEREQEWKHYVDKQMLSTEEYERLSSVAEEGDLLGKREAAWIVSEWFGFRTDVINVVTEIPLYEVNRHGALRKAGTEKREPFYSVGDVNYIAFEVCGISYEMVNGMLNQVG